MLIIKLDKVFSGDQEVFITSGMIAEESIIIAFISHINVQLLILKLFG